MKRRILALDVGRRRIGVAVSDELGLTAQAATVLENTGEEDVFAALRALVEQYDPERIVVGLPRRTDGSLGPEAQYVLTLGRRLADAVGVPVEYWDERFSTAEAERMLIEAGLRRSRRRRVVDRVAAGIILQGYLDSRRRES
ncbi:MAG: Holliday junction resolvase RuvX [Limnochordales bacterium]|nr:Holliday junction resolvase RuvX [Bacillota bacterium]